MPRKRHIASPDEPHEDGAAVQDLIDWLDAEEPVVGRVYDWLGLGQGPGEVIEVERDADGWWSRVLVEYVTGCMPMPPDDNPDAPMEEWKLPRGRAWLTREEWSQRSLR